jgi:hypothetical protein
MRFLLNLIAVIDHHTRPRSPESCWEKHQRKADTAAITFVTTGETNTRKSVSQ